MRDYRQNQILTENLKGVSDAAGDLVLESNPRRPGGVLTFDIVSCRTPTANAVASIELVSGPVVLGIRTFKLVTADWWYKTRGPVRISSDFQVRVTFSDTTAADLCEASVYGCECRPE